MRAAWGVIFFSARGLVSSGAVPIFLHADLQGEKIYITTGSDCLRANSTDSRMRVNVRLRPDRIHEFRVVVGIFDLSRALTCLTSIALMRAIAVGMLKPDYPVEGFRGR